MDYPHSGPGIASFVMSILAGLLALALLVGGIAMEEQSGGLDDDSPVLMVVGFGLLAGGAMNLMAMALGVAGMLQPRRNKTFALVGLLLSGLEVLSIIGLVILGLTLGD